MVENENKEAVKKPKLKFKIKPQFLIGALAILICVFLVVSYFNSDSSKVKSIKVVGNSFLSDEYIKEVVGIDYESRYDLILRKARGNRAKNDPLIKSLVIEKQKNHAVVIKVEENTIVGYKGDGNSSETVISLIMADGKMVALNEKTITNLALIPLFVDINDEKTAIIAKKLAEIDTEVLYRIAEVHNFSLSYDSDMVKFVMDDGYTIYSFKDAISYLNEYLKMYAEAVTKHSCILLDDITQSAVVIDCNEVEKQPTTE